ncbi:Distantly related to plant expansins [Trametes cinnabarina]|uniref:Distantly related to plant expansins n=1 Tax=Pycnoporus cinnabarinus TaxID=5643 RepID=A0A060S3E8_PYCCI|nr:Distantly related to plant expansins [Trametes cinnabarina]
MKATSIPLTFVRLGTALILAVSLASLTLIGVSAAEIDTARMALERKYTTPHSLGEGYVFNPRDGWETVNMTDLLYKYSRADSDSDMADQDGEDDSDDPGVSVLEPRAKKSKAQAKASKKPTKKANKKASAKVSAKATKATTKKLASTAGGVLSGGLSKVVNSIKGIAYVPLPIHRYTGHDLLNPSCWDNTDWHPTDASFAAALTLDGWATKPKCFKFLELCHSAQKCAFVRVVDSCAGCAKGSKHVDLTKAAFSTLANLEEGLLTVQMRQATDPEDGWLENLWGPKV